MAIRTTVTYGKCYLFSSTPMRCPLCGADVPANSQHTCASEEPTAKPRTTKKHAKVKA